VALPGFPSFPRYPYFCPNEGKQIRAIKASSVDSVGAGMRISRHMHGLILLLVLGPRLGCTLGRDRRGQDPTRGCVFCQATDGRCLLMNYSPRKLERKGLLLKQNGPRPRMDHLLKPPGSGGQRCHLNQARFGDSLELVIASRAGATRPCRMFLKHPKNLPEV